MPELTEDSSDFVLAAELLVAWLPNDMPDQLRKYILQYPNDALALVAAARKPQRKGSWGRSSRPPGG